MGSSTSSTDRHMLPLGGTATTSGILTMPKHNMLQHFFIRAWRDASVSVLMVALFLGLIFPTWFGAWQPYSPLFLQVIFFLTSLRIDFRGVWQELQDWPMLLWVTAFMLIGLPLLVFLVVPPLFPPLFVPLFLLAAMPVGMTTPLLIRLMGLNPSLALALSLTTSWLAPLTVPLLVEWFVGSQYDIALTPFFLTLVSVTVLPLVLAQGVRRLWPQLIERTARAHKPLSLFMVGFLIAAVAGYYQAALMQRFTLEYGLGLLVMTLFFLLVHGLGYWLAWWRSERDRLTITFSVVYMNFTLAIFIAEKFFGDPTVIFYTILSILPWNIGMLIFQHVVRGRFAPAFGKLPT